MASAFVLMQSRLYNQTLLLLSNRSPSPFVDFQRGDLRFSDYIIRKLSTIFGLYNPNPAIHN